MQTLKECVTIAEAATILVARVPQTTRTREDMV